MADPKLEHSDTSEASDSSIQLSFDWESRLLSSVPLIDHSSIRAILAPAIPTEVFDAFWYFAAKRQEVFFGKISGAAPPWTDDSILQQYKFTNAYRASDRVSQYLIRNVIYRGNQDPVELFFRTILFKVFNRIDTWVMLEGAFGEVTYEGYSFKKYDELLTQTMDSGASIFSPAYIMPSGKSSFGHSKKTSKFSEID